MNVKVSGHNVVVIGAVAVLVLLTLKLAAKTQLANIPLVGDVVRVGASA